MSGVGGPGAASGPAPRSAEQERLRQAAHELEGVFLAQLFRAMRASVPQSEGTQSEAQALFTSLLDDTLASRAAQRLERGLGEALYRQLSRRLADAPEAPAPPAPRET